MPSRAARTILEPGSDVDHFQVIRQLGAGGFGEVYLARDRKLGRKVALKLIHPRHVGSREAIDRFLFEVRATARFNHPHIVTVYAVGEHEGAPYVALEYLEGQTLRQRTAERRPSEREVMRIGAAIAQALAEAHTHGIVHRDLKPENVLIPNDGRVRVVDFGLAKKIAAAERRPSDLPTPAQNPSAREVEAVVAQASTLAAPDGTGSPLGSRTLPPEDADMVGRALALGIDRPTVEQLSLASFDSKDAGAVRGTPPYMGPEQWRGLALSSAADVWALGVMLFELLAGTLPFGHRDAMSIAVAVCGPEPTPQLPDSVTAKLAELITRCLDKDPDQRPSAALVAETLESLLGRNVTAREDQGPFRGLLAFGEHDAGLYFGRDAEIAALTERLRVEPTVCIVGPSGAGKSSFISGGVVPRLREQRRWLVLPLRLGTDPFRALANRLLHGEHARGDSSNRLRPTPRDRPDEPTPTPASVGGVALAGESVGSLAQSLYETPERLALILTRLAQDHDSRVLLLVDQLEELHTLVDDAEVRQRFMRALASAADDADDPVRLLSTLRDDFLGRVAATDDATRALGSVVVLRAPGRDALHEILTRPLAPFGYRYDDETLPDEMIEAVADEPACLPLLSFTARLLWERRDRSAQRLKRADYEAIGGVAGALATHADTLLSSLAPGELDVARQLLTRLVTSEGTRRTVMRERLLDGLPGGVAQRVLARLTDARLLSLRKPSSDSEPHYELAHEALITRWHRLRDWLEESSEERAFLNEAGQAAELWQRRGERADEVWQDEALDDALRELGRVRAAVPDLVRRFLGAGERERQRRTDEAENARRSRRRSLGLFGVAVLLTVTIVATAWIITRRQERRRRRDLEAATLIETAGSLLDKDPLAAKASIRRALELGDSATARLAWWRVGEVSLIFRSGRSSRISHLVFGPRGTLYGLMRGDSGVFAVDLKKQELTRLSGLPSTAQAFALSRDGGAAALMWPAKDGRVRVGVYELDTREQRWTASTPSNLGYSAQFSANGQRVCFYGRRYFGCFDAASGKPLPWRGPADPRAYAVSATDVTALVGSVAKVLVNGKPQTGWQLPTGPRAYFPVLFLADRKALIYGNADDMLWLARRGEPARLFAALGSAARTVALSPSERLVAAAQRGGLISLMGFDGRKTRVLERLQVRTVSAIRTLAFDRTERLLAAGTVTGEVRVWAFSKDLRKRRDDAGHAARVTALAVHPKGHLVISASLDKTVRLWDARSGELIGTRAVSSPVRTLRFDSSGRHLAIGHYDGAVYFTRAPYASRPVSAGYHGSSVTALAWHGRRLFAGTRKGWIHYTTRKRQRQIKHSMGEILALDVSSDGTRLAAVGMNRKTGLRTRLAIYDVDSGARRPHSALEALRTTKDVAFRGEQLVVADTQGKVSVMRRGATQQPASRPLTLGLPMALRLMHGTHTLVRGILGPLCSNCSLRLVSRATGRMTTLTGMRSPISALGGTPVPGLVATGSEQGTVQLWRGKDALPAWQTLLISADRRYVYSREHRIDTRTTQRQPLPKKRWISAMAQRAITAAENHAGIVCMATYRGFAEIWNTRSDRRLARVKLPDFQAHTRARHPNGFYMRLSLAYGVKLLRAADRDEFLLHINRQLYSLHSSGALREVARCKHAGVTERSLFCQRGRTLAVVDLDGRRPTASLRLTRYHAALAVIPDPLSNGWLLSVDSRNRPHDASSLQRQVRGTLSNLFDLALARHGWPRILAPVKAAHGETSKRLLFLGTDGGHVLAIDLRLRRQLAAWQMHGPILAIWQRGNTLHVVSERAAHRTVDISGLVRPYCEVMRDVWRKTPFAWRKHTAVPARPPRDHVCQR